MKQSMNGQWQNNAHWQRTDNFIPHSRQQLLELCLAEGRLSQGDAQRFRAFCELFTAYAHFRFHQLEEKLKNNYLPWNPDAELVQQLAIDPAHLPAMQEELLKTLTLTMERANYWQLDLDDIAQAINSSDLIDLQTEIDYTDIDHVILYYRGQRRETGQVTKFFLWKKTIPMLVFGHVLLGIKFKEAAHFIAKKINPKHLNFQPGRMYFYLYKHIPSNDLELLFPNVRLSMNFLDRLLFIVPAMGAGISVLLKAGANLVLLLGVILFFTLGPSFAQRVGVDEGEIHNAAPVLLAFLSVAVALGSFAYRQYDSYKNKRIQFLKNVTETLFFKNLANNANVFYSIIHAGEEEECKETLLVYYHLTLQNGCLTVEQLKEEIQRWLQERTNLRIDLPIDKILQNLCKMEYAIVSPGAIEAHRVALLKIDPEGRLTVPRLLEAKMVLDRLWDNAFDY